METTNKDYTNNQYKYSWQPICVLSALGFSGSFWPIIDQYGGPMQLLKDNIDVVAFYYHNKSLIKKQSSQLLFAKPMIDKNHLQKFIDEDLAKAISKSNQLKYFIGSGGIVLGSEKSLDLSRLNKASSAPLCAFARGDSLILQFSPVVSIVGTRNPSVAGERRAFKLAFDLAKRGCIIASGGAMGIDLAAHKGAIKAGGKTICILGNGVKLSSDERPDRVKSLFNEKQFLCISTTPPWIATSKNLFVSRNRLIAAISDAVVIVEGKEKSGSLYTANYAQKLNIPIWAIPGDVDSANSFAPNSLIESNQARALVNWQKLFSSLSLKKVTQEINLQNKKDIKQYPLTPLQQHLYDSGGESTIDILSNKLNKPIQLLQTEVFQLQLLGKIKKQGAKIILIKH